MDSYSQYKAVCDEIRRKRVYDETWIRSMAKQLIVCIADELRKPPYTSRGSTFIAYVKKRISDTPSMSANWGGAYTSGLVYIDAYAIIYDLAEYMQKGYSNYLMCSQFVQKHTLFRDQVFSNTDAAERIRLCLRQIDSCLDSLREKALQASETRIQESQAVTVKPHAVQEAHEDISSTRKRLEDNRRAIQEWHENQKALAGEITKLQPDISRVLKGFMSFSDLITNDYVLQFAKMYIALFNLIQDSLDSHKAKAESSGLKDYLNAVMNHEDFCRMIADDLSAFGVEEIHTDPGEKFNVKQHEAANTTRFSPSDAVVRCSVRSGFMYNGIILQKEKVNV